MSKLMAALLHPRPPREQGSSAELLGCSRTAQKLLQTNQPNRRTPISTAQFLSDPHVRHAVQELLPQGSCQKSPKLMGLPWVHPAARTPPKAGEG